MELGCKWVWDSHGISAIAKNQIPNPGKKTLTGTSMLGTDYFATGTNIVILSSTWNHQRNVVTNITLNLAFKTFFTIICTFRCSVSLKSFSQFFVICKIKGYILFIIFFNLTKLTTSTYLRKRETLCHSIFINSL